MIAAHCVLDLSEDVFVHCLSYLTPEELSQCNSVGSVFSHRVHHESLWKYWLADSFGIDSNSLEYPPGYPQDQIVNSCMNCFISWKLSFPGYSSHDVRRTNNWWKRFESWCRQYAPEILTTLNPPASESDIDTVESDLNCPLPCSLKIFYRFHNGQHIPHQNRASIGWGIFGGTQFYDSFVNLKFLSLDFLGRFTPQCRSMDSDILPHPKCLGINPNGQSMSLVDNNLYYEDDDINGLLSNHLPDSNRAPVDSVEDLFVFAKNIGRTQKVYCIGSDHPSNSRGGIVYVNTRDFSFIPCHPTSNFTNYQDFHSSDSFFLLWIEEYLNRLERGIYRYQPLDLTDPAVQLHPIQMHEKYSIKMISLIPLLPLYNPLPSRAQAPASPAASAFASGIPENVLNSRRNFGATKRISHGVEAVTCPVFIPELFDPHDEITFFWSYSIRLRLLSEDPSRPSHMSRCQLISRHWNLFEPLDQETIASLNSTTAATATAAPAASGHFDRVDGEGVIGLHPQLDISYSQHPIHDWPFAYQSCSNSANFPGQFAGHMTFVSGSMDQPTGPTFPVHLEPFGLGVPDFIY